jgi:cytochrome c6
VPAQGGVIKAAAILGATVLSAAFAVASFASTPRIAGNALAGKRVWLSAQPACSLCHTLAAAKAIGTKGPNLDKAKPSYARIVRVVTNGLPPSGHYVASMQSYGGVLSAKQIQNVAAFVYEATHKSGSS